MSLWLKQKKIIQFFQFDGADREIVAIFVKSLFFQQNKPKKIRSIFFFWNFWTLSISKLSKHKQINFGIESRELEKNQPTNKTNADKVK